MGGVDIIEFFDIPIFRCCEADLHSYSHYNMENHRLPSISEQFPSTGEDATAEAEPSGGTTEEDAVALRIPLLNKRERHCYVPKSDELVS